MNLFNHSIYLDHLIHFNYNDDTVLVNATDMAKAFNNKPVHFLRLESTQKFIQALTKKVDPDFKGDNRPLKNSRSEISHLKELNYSDKVLIIRKGRHNPGTWMHRHLAINFAFWLDPEFQLWVIEELDKSFGFHKEQYTYFVNRLAEIEKEDEAFYETLNQQEVYRRKEANRKEKDRLKRKFAAYNKENIKLAQMALEQQPPANL
jgi:hypothetical protein